MITTRELAELAGVSQSTVSRSLNDRPEISPETKERIRALAKEHGYIFKRSREKVIAQTNRKAIGILMMRHMFFDDLFINQLVCELNSFISDENYYSMPLLDYWGTSGVEKLHDLLSLNLIEGLVIINRQYDEAIAQYCERIKIPCVYLIYHLRNSTKQAHIVDSDNFAGGYIATKHLISLGHRRIATITTPWAEFEDRTSGYREALQEAGIPFHPDLVFRTQADYDSCYQTIRRRSKFFRSVTGLFAQFDVGALGAMSALIDEGYRIPEDVSVIGLDGLDIGNMYRPALTSVGQPFRELARTAVSQLLKLVDFPSGQVESTVFLRPELIVRSSTGPVREVAQTEPLDLPETPE